MTIGRQGHQSVHIVPPCSSEPKTSGWRLAHLTWWPGTPGGFVRGSDRGVPPSVLPCPTPSLQASKVPAQVEVLLGVAAGRQVSMEREREAGREAGREGGGRGREEETWGGQKESDRDRDRGRERDGGVQGGQRQGMVRPRHPSSCGNTWHLLGRSPLRAQQPLLCLVYTQGF